MAEKFLSSPHPPTQEAIVGPGGRLTFAWERFFDRLEGWVTKRPSCCVQFTTNQTITTATYTDLLFSAEDHDNAAMHDTSSNTDRIVIPSDGVYSFGTFGQWEASAAGYRRIHITLNDPAASAASAQIIRSFPEPAGFLNDNITYSSGRTRSFSAGDILRVEVYQNTGGDLDVLGTTTTPAGNGFWCFKVSS